MAILLLNEAGHPGTDVLAFGTGAIGGAIVNSLLRRGGFSASEFRVPWTESVERAESLEEASRLLSGGEFAQRGPLSVVWAAGKAGFSASEEEVNLELEAYRDVLRLVQCVGERRGAGRCSFHLISSAGGLYEGRTVWGASETPTPTRCYGYLKLQEEEEALTYLDGLCTEVYRPSSVYTVPAYGRRTGLIGKLIHNGLAGNSTTIVGAFDTLRDYVMARDVGAYVGDRILEGARGESCPHMLVSAHPVSVRQIITMVQSVLGRPLYIRVAEAWNARNIIFLQPARAGRFKPTPLGVGIKRVYIGCLGMPLR